jgi:hypothetical protein
VRLWTFGAKTNPVEDEIHGEVYGMMGSESLRVSKDRKLLRNL